MKRILCVLLSVLLVFCLAAEGETMKDLEPLHELTDARGFKLGAPISFYQMNDLAYLTMVARHFNSVTPTNELKAYSLLDQWNSRRSEDGMPRMNFTQADRMVNWAQMNGVGVRGHVLVWDAYMTEWFFHEDYDVSKPFASPEVMRERTRSYIEQVITHFEEKFPGVIYCWDVVNEAVGDSIADYDPSDARHIRTTRGGTPNLFYRYLGKDYVEFAFLCARDTVDRLGADITLVYNDYNTFYAEKRMAISALLESINTYAQNEDGSYRRLVDAVGMQGYIGGYGQQAGCMNDNDIEYIRASIRAYADLGYEVHVTEMAVRNYDIKQAALHVDFYGRLFEMFVSMNEDTVRLTGVSIWGLCDNPYMPTTDYSYKQNSPYCGLIDNKYLPKPETYAVIEALKK